MAAPLDVDWNYIQSLYLKGLTPKKISDQTGIKADSVSNRAHRYKWRDALAKASVVIKAHNDAMPTNEPESASLTKTSNRVRSGLAGVLERSIDRLEQLSFKTPKAALKANAELESVVRNAKTVFGWSDSQSSPHVRINILGDAQIQTDSMPVQQPQPVIDLPSEHP